MSRRTLTVIFSFLFVFIICAGMTGCKKSQKKEGTIAVESMSTENERSWTVESLCGQAEEYIGLYIETGMVESKWIYTALQKALEARKIDKTSPIPHRVMAKAYMASGEPDKAYERLQMAIILSPEDPEAKGLIADLRAKIITEQGGLIPGDQGIEARDFSDGKYIGGLKDGKRDGYGIFTGTDGFAYTGEWEEDMKDGPGTACWANGDLYSGEWLDGKRTGHGLYIWPTGEEYAGQFTAGVRQGHGSTKFPNGNSYVGEYLNNKPYNGHGIGNYSNGVVYKGEYADGKANGHGIDLAVDGAIYVGQFNNGVRNGHGYVRYPNGVKYVGEFIEGKEHGHGKKIYKDGSNYVGQIRNGQFQGNGVYTWPTGNWYIGQWTAGKAAGGTFGFADGTRTWASQNDQGQWVHKKQ